jgi:hypothetical protein
MDIVTLFCNVDDFCKENDEIVLPRRLKRSKLMRNRKRKLIASEVMTILILFHSSDYRTFKHYYLNYVSSELRQYFPNLVSYNRFIELTSTVLEYLCLFLKSRFGMCTGISFIDSTAIKVCGYKRISRNKVFKNIAKMSKSTMGWFFGFKLHLIINDEGEILSIKFTQGNVDDRTPVPKMVRKIFGWLFGDKGYVDAKLFKNLYSRGIKLITPIKKNMKNKLISLKEKLLLRKRSIIETVNDQLKNISQIEHTRHRSCFNFMVNIICGLIAYTYQAKKPSIKHHAEDCGIILS